MKKYGYLDKANILHIVEKEKTAKEFSKNGKVIETEIEAERGFPVHNGRCVKVYSETEMKYDAQGNTIEIIPELAELYKQCK